jgi:hypothetical protein
MFKDPLLAGKTPAPLRVVEMDPKTKLYVPVDTYEALTFSEISFLITVTVGAAAAD